MTSVYVSARAGPANNARNPARRIRTRDRLPAVHSAPPCAIGPPRSPRSSFSEAWAWLAHRPSSAPATTRSDTSQTTSCAPTPAGRTSCPISSGDTGRVVDLAGDPGATLAIAPAYRRLFDSADSTSWAEIGALASPVDRILVTALYCDRVGLPEGWLGTLRAAGDHGGYALTHAAIAEGWTRENGCKSAADLGPLRGRLLDQLERLIEDRDALAENNDRASDIWIEALALHAHAGAGSRVRSEWLDALVALQRNDGGWAEHPRGVRSSPHTTIFALWALLEALEPVSRHVPMIPR